MTDPTLAQSSRCACPKCGDWSDRKPRYNAPNYFRGLGERLQWVCPNCLYSWTTPTFDATQKESKR